MCNLKICVQVFCELTAFGLISTLVPSPSLITEKDSIKKAIYTQPRITRPKQLAPYIKINSSVEIPDFFDARDHWSRCNSVSRIRNHQSCAAAWAFTAVEIMADRLCIQTNAEIQVQLSPQDLLSCCENCDGCNVGNSVDAWKFWVDYGIVSGGDYDGSFQGCKPYLENTAYFRQIPPCQKKCRRGYKEKYRNDKYFGDNFYLIAGVELQIQIEIMTNGPVQAGFEVYEDLFTYKNGVYRHHSTAKYIGYTYVKLLGWGRDGDSFYWIAAVPWGKNLENIKIIRGKNEGGIEANVVAGKARLNRSVFLTSSSPTCITASIRSLSIMLTVSWWAFVVNLCSIFKKLL